MAQFVKLSVFLKNEFVKGQAPTRKTARRLIDEGELAGRRIGGQYYVDLQKFNLTGDKLVDQVLLAS